MAALRVVWVGSFEPTFNRNVKLARLMDLAGVDFTFVRISIWGSDLVRIASFNKLRVAIRLALALPAVFLRMLMQPAPDVYLASYPGWFDIPVVWLASRLKKRPLVFDPYISVYDTLVTDRRLASRRSPLARLARLTDRLAFRLADLVLVDTEAHGAFYESILPQVAVKTRVIHVGADDTVFKPCDHGTARSIPRVLFYGNYIPLHGVPTIIEAANRLREEDIEFVIVGRGQDRQTVEERVALLGLGKVKLLDPVPLERLGEMVCEADVCLGVFGDSDKAGRVVPNKVYEGIAARKPVITRAGPGIAGAFAAGEVMVVPPADPVRLAEEIVNVISDSARSAAIADSAWRRYMEQYHESVLAPKLLEALRDARPTSSESGR